MQLNSLIQKHFDIRQPYYNNSRLPLLIYMVFISTGIALWGEGTFLGYNLSGWGWVIPLTLSIIRILQKPIENNFPLHIWAAWISVLLIYPILTEFPFLQRTVQLLCPIVVGMATGTYSYTENQISDFLRLCKHLSVMLIVITFLKSGIFLTGKLPEITGLAPEVMTGMLLCSIFAAGYALGAKEYLTWWLLLAALPVIALTRTAIVATALTLPLTFAPMKLNKRIFFIVLIVLTGLALFSSTRIQTKMFYSGRGELTDIMSTDLRTTGRFYIWDYFKEGIHEKPWFGHGVGAGEVFTSIVTNDITKYPHNDWLLTLYDFGIFGTGIFATTIVLAILHSTKKSHRSEANKRILLLGGGSAFIPFVMLMYTDNIMVYASFFGNLHFTALGIAYATLRTSSRRSLQQIIAQPKLRRAS